MTKARTLLFFGAAVVAAVGAGAFGFYLNAAPACDSNRTLGRVYDILHGDFHLDSVFVNDVRTVRGDVFSTDRDCVADVTPIRGNVNADTSQWHEIHFHVAQQETARPLDVTVQMGGDVPLAPAQASLWRRLLAHL